MKLMKPLVPKHADGVLRVYLPKRTSTVERVAVSVDAERRDEETWLGGVYAGPVAYFEPPGDADTSPTSLTSVLAIGRCDLILVGEIRDLTRYALRLFMLVYDCIDNGVRLIARNDGIDTASAGWETDLHVAVLRSGMLSVPQWRRRRRTAARKA